MGCRLNQAETAIIQRGFEKEGFRVVDFGEPADLVVINTCTVTENGDTDTRRLVNRINRQNAGADIALIGCQAQIQGEKLLQMPGVKWIVGNAVKMDLARIFREAGEDMPRVLTPAIKRESFTIAEAGIDRKHTRANLKIQDGCDFFCAFCEIPFARGRARSRVFQDILQEAQTLVGAGHQELVLTGINVGTYRYQDKRILDVITALERIEGLRRIRISSVEPTTIPGELLHKMAEKGKLCRYLHIPVQSGHDEILQAMNRKYTAREFADFIQRAAALIPNVCLGTDVMVGFPGETDRHFDDTYEMMRELPFAYFHVFSYSDRNRARSRKLENKVPREIIIKRSQRMRELSARKRRAYLEKQLASTEWVLIEQKKNGYWTGLTDTYVRVRVKSDLDLHNQFVPVRLEDIDNQTIIGRVQ